MKIVFKVAFTLAFVALVVTVQAQRNSGQDTMQRYYRQLAASKNEADKEMLRGTLYALLQSNKEKDWNMAASYFYQLKRSTSDSIRKLIPVKFPLGVSARNEAADTTIFRVPEGKEKEACYKTWVKKFPPKNFPDDRMWYDYARAAISKAYAKEGNVNKSFEYANRIETSAYKPEGYAGAAEELVKNSHYKEALLLYTKARDTAYSFINKRRNEYGAQFAAGGYSIYSGHIAEILVKQKKYAEALPYARLAHDSSRNVRGAINTTYATVLAALGRNEEAFAIINEAVKAGQGTAEIKDLLKTVYVKVKGSDAGYDEYIAQLDKQLEARVREDLAKQMIKIPAANFTIKDVDGNTVSLADYKGKIVVLDFWATWCGPCKRSFPAMKLAQAKFKDDPNVKFLFIHTMEHEAPAVATVNAKKYVTDNNFPFQVLMDVANPETGMNDVAKNYKVDGIPTKFIIDKNGNIRFRLLGFSGTDEAAVHEVVTMVDMANTK